MNRICIIPARGGSRRIPGKNIKEFHGMPMLWYAIERARAFESGLFDRIIVSTDSQEVADVAFKYGAEVWSRALGYGADDVGTQAVVAECLRGIGAKPNDEVCCIYPTVPLMDVWDLVAGHKILTGHGNGVVDYVISVGYPELRDAGQFYWGMGFSFLSGAPLISHRTRMVCVDESRVCDINTPEDWDRAVKMYEALK